MMIPLWTLGPLALLAFCLLISTAYFHLKLGEAEEREQDERQGRQIALARIEDLEARLEPFKAYEDQVSR